MFKKLQRRFMWVSSLVLLAVILLVMGAVYWIMTGVMMTQTGVLMDLILDNGGDLPDRSNFDANQQTFLALNTESIYETRFFSAEQVEDGVDIIKLHIAALSEEDAEELTEQILNRRSPMGSIQVPGNRVLHYAKRTTDEGTTMVVVVDATSRFGMIRLILMYMLALWFAVLLLYTVIMGRFSARLIRPFIENDERQKRFITNASHELKTPLAVISANTEMTEVLGGQSKWTQSTRRQIQRLQALIEDLVVLARLDEMKDVDLVDVDLSALVTEAAESFRSVAQSVGKSFENDIAPDLHIRGDRRGIQQVTSILLDNAIKYCDDGGKVALRLESRARGKGARIIISNTYAEGKDVDTSRFFERFYRQDESHNSEKTGFGIGLSMAKEIVARMKGKLKVTTAGDTISFTVEL